MKKPYKKKGSIIKFNEKDSMFSPTATALFFPDYGSSGLPWDLLLLHFYFFAITIPFIIIFNAARNSDRENPNRVKDETTRYPDLHPRA